MLYIVEYSCEETMLPAELLTSDVQLDGPRLVGQDPVARHADVLGHLQTTDFCQRQIRAVAHTHCNYLSLYYSVLYHVGMKERTAITAGAIDFHYSSVLSSPNYRRTRIAERVARQSHIVPLAYLDGRRRISVHLWRD